jgi:hypothetical protein
MKTGTLWPQTKTNICMCRLIKDYQYLGPYSRFYSHASGCTLNDKVIISIQFSHMYFGKGCTFYDRMAAVYIHCGQRVFTLRYFDNCCV